MRVRFGHRVLFQNASVVFDGAGGRYAADPVMGRSVLMSFRLFHCERQDIRSFAGKKLENGIELVRLGWR
jgi:hypothetical protein